ncbi:integrase arm-type DNA-binding domain-containing protein [Pseudomonas sp. ADAK2 TE3594]
MLIRRPEISLRDARAQRDVARALVARGIDPRVHRQLAIDRSVSSLKHWLVQDRYREKYAVVYRVWRVGPRSW